MPEIKRLFLSAVEGLVPSATETNGIVYARGILPIRYDNPRARIPEGIEQQAALVFSHMDTLLTHAGLTLDRLLTVEIALANLARDFARMDRIYLATFGTIAPARACIGVQELPEQALIQINFTAAR